MKLKKCIDWIRMLSSQEKIYKEGSLTVYVYGEEDQSYIVIEDEISKSPKVIDQYTVHAVKKENDLFELISFLHECNFDLKNVVSKISSAEYIEDGMNDICKFEYVEVARYQVQEN